MSGKITRSAIRAIAITLAFVFAAVVLSACGASWLTRHKAVDHRLPKHSNRCTKPILKTDATVFRAELNPPER